jgi:ABC-2 type transport system ATP-binding protein
MNIIEVSNLVKKYKKADKNAVDSISFSVKEGEFFAFLGPNGAGKTTTISILTTTLGKTSGDIKILDYDIETQSSLIRRNVGIIFQKPSIDLNLTAEENIRFHAILYGLYKFAPSFKLMPKDYQDRVINLAEVIGIKEDLFKAVKTFSGGMKRKLEIIRSLMHSPKLLFLDEPTVGLDPESRRNLWQYLQNVRKTEGVTVFLTTHYLDEVEGADHVCIINKGKIAADGTPTEIKKNISQEYVLMQSEDLKTLEEEVKNLGHKYSVENNVVKVFTEKDYESQKLIAGLKTKLTHLDIHKASLEDAYIEIIHETLDL